MLVHHTSVAFHIPSDSGKALFGGQQVISKLFDNHCVFFVSNQEYLSFLNLLIILRVAYKELGCWFNPKKERKLIPSLEGLHADLDGLHWERSVPASCPTPCYKELT